MAQCVKAVLGLAMRLIGVCVYRSIPPIFLKNMREEHSECARAVAMSLPEYPKHTNNYYGAGSGPQNSIVLQKGRPAESLTSMRFIRGCD